MSDPSEDEAGVFEIIRTAFIGVLGIAACVAIIAWCRALLSMYGDKSWLP